MEQLIYILQKIRAISTRFFKPKKSYILGKSISPISSKYGFDRGKPIDRNFIEQFLKENRKHIKGKCLEVVDNNYTNMFGGKKVTTSDVLDIFPTRKANIHGDLRNIPQIKDNTYDCLILTQVLNVIDNYEAAITEGKRILKPGGVMLVTVPTISPCWNLKINLWRFTHRGAYFVFNKYFEAQNIFIKSYGNLETAKAFWIGLATEDISIADLLYNDPFFPLIIGIKVIKKKKHE